MIIWQTQLWVTMLAVFLIGGYLLYRALRNQ